MEAFQGAVSSAPLIITTTLECLQQAAKELIQYAASCPLWTFSGPMGAGKTTLIRAICRCLGVATAVSSPTFSLIHTYYLPDGRPLYHMDAYRIDSYEALEGMDYPFYFETGAYTFIEWPENIQCILPPQCLHITLLPAATSTTRQLTAHF
jgi:tRNA threonylcarbamoyladenosine biosynthesis protein TsaE